MDNQEKLAALGTQDKLNNNKKRNKTKTNKKRKKEPNVLDTTKRKQTQIT